MAKRIWELYNNLQMSYQQIAKQLNCAATTVHAALRRFENDGRQFRDRRMFNGKNNRRLKIVAPIAKYLLSRDVLERWSGYCLQQRCIQLDIDTGVQITQSTLRNFYLKHNIKYRCVSFTYQQALKKAKGPILDFSLALARMVIADKPIVYFDESSFNMWMRGNRNWTPHDKPIKWPLNQTRGSGITVLGGISTNCKYSEFKYGKNKPYRGRDFDLNQMAPQTQIKRHGTTPRTIQELKMAKRCPNHERPIKCGTQCF